MSNREIFIDKLRQLSKEEMLERYIALLNTEKLNDYVADLETKLADLQQEQIKEMKEHQEAMQVADKTIKELEANLELHKQSNMVLNDQLNKATEHLSELEDKIAESEKLIFTYQNIFKQKPETALEMCEFVKPYERKLGKQELEIKQLKHQLADTETQNKRVLEKLELIVSANQELEQKLAESENSLKCTIDHYEKYCAELNSQNVMLYASDFNHNQDKISFALEQLEKVKGYFGELSFYEMYDEIDNQIKQLKEMK